MDGLRPPTSEPLEGSSQYFPQYPLDHATALMSLNADALKTLGMRTAGADSLKTFLPYSLDASKPLPPLNIDTSAITFDNTKSLPLLGLDGGKSLNQLNLEGNIPTVSESNKVNQSDAPKSIPPPQLPIDFKNFPNIALETMRAITSTYALQAAEEKDKPSPILEKTNPWDKLDPHIKSVGNIDKKPEAPEKNQSQLPDPLKHHPTDYNNDKVSRDVRSELSTSSNNRSEESKSLANPFHDSLLVKSIR